MYLSVLNIPLQFSHFIYLRFQKVVEKTPTALLFMTAYAFSMAFRGLFTRALTHNFQHFTSNALARLDSTLSWLGALYAI